MVLDENINTLEKAKFCEVNSQTAVRVCAEDVTGTFSPSGLKIAGKVTLVTLSDSSWTALPVSSLTNRNAMRVQNQSAVEVKTNYDPLVPGYVGMWIKPNGEAYWDITDNIVLYAKSSSGPAVVAVEEIS